RISSFYCSGAPRDLHSFPTRRSSDLQVRRRRERQRLHPPQARLRQELGQVRQSHRELDGPQGRRRPRQGPVVHHAQEGPAVVPRSEEHTSELQSRENLVCRLLLEKKK